MSGSPEDREIERLESLLKQTEGIAAQRMQSCATLLARAETAEAKIAELELKLVRQYEVAREAYDAAIWKYGAERIKLEDRVKELEAQITKLRTEVTDWLNTAFQRGVQISTLKMELIGKERESARLREVLEKAMPVLIQRAHCHRGSAKTMESVSNERAAEQFTAWAVELATIHQQFCKALADGEATPTNSTENIP